MNAQWPEFLTDPGWLDVIIAVIAFSIGTALTVFIFKRQMPQKRLSYEVITVSPLLQYDDSLAQDIKIIYKGEEINSLFLTEFQLKNSGNTSLLPTDFTSPLRIDLSETRIFSADIPSTTPEDLEAIIIVENGGVRLEPLLLNEGDSIRVRILTDSAPQQSSVKGRIVGVKTITRIEKAPMDFGVLGNALLDIVATAVSISTPGGAQLAGLLFEKRAVTSEDKDH